MSEPLVHWPPAHVTNVPHWEEPAPPASAEELHEYMDAVRTFELSRTPKQKAKHAASTDHVASEHSAPARAPRFRLMTVGDLASIVQPPALIADFLSQRGFSSVVAPYDSYKSFIALGISLCVAHGFDWYGHRVTPGPTVYQAGEGANGLHKRCDAFCKLNGIPEAGGIWFLPQSLKLNDARDLSDLLAALRGLPNQPLLVTLDTFARSLRGNESGQEDTGLYVEAVDAIRDQIGAHVQIVHHAGWEGTRSRGSSNIPASLDTELTLSRDGERVTITVTKQKDAEPAAPITLEAVPIADSLAFRPFAPTSSKLSDNERETLRVVQESGPLKTTAWSETSDIPRRSFFAAKKRLLALGYVKETREGFTATDAGRQAP